ncbi:MAG: hypothetical protein IPI39_06250 [Candidatus Obscuribacter sp.]|nr:hypothetical protein [Candidatus Obscuribacter sp.]
MKKTANLNARFLAQFIAHTGSPNRLPVALIALFMLFTLCLPALARTRSHTAKRAVSHSSHRTRGKAVKHTASRKSGRHTARSSHGRVSHATKSKHHVSRVYKPEPGIAPADPVWESEPRRRNYSLINQAYQLYDRALSEKTAGNYGVALDKLGEAVNILDQARSHQRNNVPSTFEAHVFYELGQIAELDNDAQLARDSYVHCFKAAPNFVEAYVHLATLLAGKGDLAQALNYARDGVRLCPEDVRLKTVVQLLESKSATSPNVSDSIEP